MSFTATGLDTSWTDLRTTGWSREIAGQKSGDRHRAGAPSSAASFPYTLERKDRTVYFAALLMEGRQLLRISGDDGADR